MKVVGGIEKNNISSSAKIRSLLEWQFTSLHKWNAMREREMSEMRLVRLAEDRSHTSLYNLMGILVFIIRKRTW